MLSVSRDEVVNGTMELAILRVRQSRAPSGRSCPTGKKRISLKTTRNTSELFGFGNGGLLDKGSFQKSPFSRDSRVSRDSREPQTVENKGDSDHFLEILEIFEILENLEKKRLLL